MVDDHCGIAAQFQHDFLLAGLGLQIPADPGRAGEGKQLQPLVNREQVGAIPTCGQNREGAFRQIGLCQYLAHDDRAQRRLAGRLHHERTADGNRRCDLVRREIEREVERGNEAAGADGNAFPHAHIAFCPGRNVERLDLAIVANRLFRGDPERVDQAGGFAFRILDRLAGFDTERIGQFVEPLLEPVDTMLQHILAFKAGHGGHRFGGGDRSRYRLFNDIRGGQSGPEGDFIGIFVGYLQIHIGLHRLVVEIERIDVF